MLFDKKVKRGMDVMNERNRQYLDGLSDHTDRDEASSEEETPAQTRAHEEEYHRLNDEPGLEKGDIPALILSALLVFGPIILILVLLLTLAWVLLH